MSARILEQLTSDDFAVSAGSLSMPSSLRRFLQRTPEVAAVKEALKQEAITERTLRQFVSSLLQDLRRGERFPHELAIAALAVVLETRPTDFADEFLHDLARLELAEMSLCVRVARECLRYRSGLTRNMTKHFGVAPADGEAMWLGSWPGTRTPKSAGKETDITCKCEAG